MSPALVAWVFVGMVAVAGTLLVRWLEARELAKNRRLYRMQFPRDLDPARVVYFLAGLSGLLPPWWRRPVATPAVVFEVLATEEAIDHYLLVPASLEPVVISHLRAALPGVRLTPQEGLPRWVPALASELALSTHDRPLRVDVPQAVAAAILATLHPLHAEEAAALQWVIAPAGLRRVPRQASESGAASGLWSMFLPKRGLPDARAVREAEAKQAEPLFLAVGRIAVRAESASRQRQLLRRIEGAFHLANAPGVHLRVRFMSGRRAASRFTARAIPLGSWPSTLNAAELVGLLAFPMKDVVVSGLSVGIARQLPPPSEIPRVGTVLARSTYPGAERPLAIAPQDRLRHLSVLGPTGAGKSTLLLNVIVQDMNAGFGVVVVDPKKDLIEDCLARVPDHRIDDVIVLDPTDQRPVGLNPIEASAEESELVVEQVVGIFRTLYSEFWGPRTDDILRAATATLVGVPGMTLTEIGLLLTDEAFRRRLVSRIDDPVGLEPFWGWYGGLSDAERTNAIGPVLNKLRAFTMRPRIRSVIGQSAPALDFDRLLASQGILFVPLSKGLLGEDAASLVGALVLARLWQATLKRAALPADQRRPVFCAIDEWQDYLHLPTKIGDMLVQARSYGLGLVLANQHLAQLTAAMRDGLLANARSKCVFQTSAKDARALAPEFGPLGPDDLQGLGAYEVALKVAIGGRVSSPATGVALPPPPMTGNAEAVRASSRQRFGRDRTDVEAAIQARQLGRTARQPIGRQRRMP
jgi:hypothetical protein